jgi:very-short-patch-repair endonuclease
LTDIVSPMDGVADKLRLKVRQLYAFLKEANQIQFRPVRKLSDQQYVIRISDMPKHPSAQLFRPVKVENSSEVPDVLIRVSRPKLTRCPSPPDSFSEWLLPNWDDPYLTPEVAKSKNIQENVLDEDGNEVEITKTILFTEDPLRVDDFGSWLEKRNIWTDPELVARGAMKYFENFYTLYSRIEKEGEKLELLVADGILSWNTESGIDGAVSIQHPLLLKRVELRFNPNIPEFTVHETDREVELYNNLFLDLKEVESVSIRNRKEEIENSGYHPLGWEDTSAFLKAFALTVSPTKGEYLDEPSDGTKNHPRIWRDPVLVLRNRTAGIANAVDKILDHIDGQPLFPQSLSQITGEETEWTASGFSGNQEVSSSHAGEGAREVEHFTPKDILLVNEANDEQIEIVKRLDRSGSVVVQGPPGTGKTHTISNLIGHLLSQGKSILVTAHTTKALRVLRDKVPDMLKPLCVSVLGSDQLARRQLESAVSSITERLTSETYESLAKKGERYAEERSDLIKRQLALKHLLREAIENEYKTINLDEKKYAPADAGRLVSQNKIGNDWIPSPINISVSIEPKITDIERLYVLGNSFDQSEEDDSRLHIPDLTDLPNEGQFKSMVADYESLLIQDLSAGKDKWLESKIKSEELALVLADLLSEFDDELLAQSWRPFTIVAGLHGEIERQVWTSLTEKIELTVNSSAKYSLTLQHRATLSNEIPIHKQFNLLSQICVHLEGGGKLGFLQLATKSEWRHLLKGVKVAAGEPTHLEHFNALRQIADLKVKRLDLEELWNALIGNLINQPFDQLGNSPEQSCRALIPEIKRCLNWNDKVWTPLAGKLKSNGLKLDELLSALPRETTQIAEYTVIEKFARSQLIFLVEKELARRKLKEIENNFTDLKNLVANTDLSKADQGCVGRITKAVNKKDVGAYELALDYLRRILAVKPLVEERDILLGALKEFAPAWANLVAQRVSPHDQINPPGNISQAWLWRQLNDVLDERSKLDAQQVQKELEGVAEMLREVTRLLVDAKAWSEQLKRLQSDNSMRQALVGWLDTAKRLASTRQLEKRQSLLSEARKLMRKCSEAVPVWIMPISIMAESFDPQTTKFDVVIIDEASQADINALIPLYMGKQIIVVGDHEQVTPLGVGKDQTILENLRKSMLKDIPNAHLYDNMSSIYDLARQSFGEGVRLVEHFRCVPQIISFSNALSYEGKIRPLREANSSNLKPSCVPFRVNGIREGDVNRGEAEQIVAFIKAMIKHETYAGKSIGVISMLGESQAVLIQSIIHKEIESVEIESRRIQSGISGEFQGDERDVIFLSMVDSAADTNTLRTTGDGAFEQTKKRYNVAVSRARDQLWVIHSFDPDLHLKAADIRYRLLQHVRDPDSSIRNFEQEVGRTESPFEKEVLKRLTSAGFRVTTQVEVGYFRIDMVVEGEGKRLAVECDGDRYHPIEKLAEDMNRQAILERLGWKFARIRGSAFYRNPDQAMESVFKRLDELEILPNSSGVNGNCQSDKVLIEELKTIIANGFVDEPFNEPSSQLIDDHAKVFAVQTVEPERSYDQPEVTPNSQRHNVIETNLEATPTSPSSVANLPKGKIGINLIEYTHYSGPACHDPRVTNHSQIADDLLNIIKEEGPVQVKRTFDIYLRSCGIRRMGHDLQAKLVKALDSLKLSKKISSHKYNHQLDVLAEITWVAGFPCEVIRTRGDRSLEEIPLGELFGISRSVSDSQGLKNGSEEHLRAVLDALDLRRLTTNAETILKEAINGELASLFSQSTHSFSGDTWREGFMEDYFVEDGNPIVFFVGCLKKFGPVEDKYDNAVFIWANNEFSKTRFKLFGFDDGSGMILGKANRLAQLLNENSKNHLVPLDFEDWWIEETKARLSEIIASSKI